MMSSLKLLGVERDERRHRGNNPRRDEAGHKKTIESRRAASPLRNVFTSSAVISGLTATRT
jgi:hypothetical protein